MEKKTIIRWVNWVMMGLCIFSARYYAKQGDLPVAIFLSLLGIICAIFAVYPNKMKDIKNKMDNIALEEEDETL